MKLSVIIPAYNEIETIEEIIDRVRAVRLDIPIWANHANEAIVQMEREIVVVDDGSTDGTRDYLNTLRGVDDLIAIFHEHNQGKGGAVWTGLKATTGTSA